MADRISPDAPVPNVKINKTETYLGAIGLVLQYIKSLGGKPEICTIVGDDFGGDFFVKKIKQLNVDPSNIIIAEEINTPQITRIKAMDQHLLRLETDYKAEIPQNYINEKKLGGLGIWALGYDNSFPVIGLLPHQKPESPTMTDFPLLQS